MKINRMMVDMTLPEDFVWHLPSGRDDYLFVLFKSPSVLVVEGEKIPVGVGDAVLFDKLTPQYYYPSGGSFVHDFIHFDYESEAEKKEFSFIPYSKVIHISDYVSLSDTLRILSQYHVLASQSGTDIVRSLGRAFLLMIRDNIDREQSVYFERLLALRTRIYSNPQHAWTVEEMARSVAMSRSRLQLFYRESFGISCINDVISARMAMAKKLLCGTGLTVAQIAELCGYENVTHFIRQFKRCEALTPGQYKKRQGARTGECGK